MMATTIDPHTVFPSLPLPVDVWYTSLSQLSHLQNPSGEKQREVRDRTVVTKLFFCKENSRSQHEYIVADLRRGEHDYVHATIDRYRGDAKSEGEEVDIQDASGLPAVSMVGVLCCTDSQKVSHALDRVQCTPGKFKSDKLILIKFYEFKEGNTPTLVDLSIAAYVAHKYAQTYSVFSHQCYWYADAVCAVIETLQPYSQTTKRETYTRGTEMLHLESTEVPAFTVPLQAGDDADMSANGVSHPPWTGLKQGHNVVRIARRPAKLATTLRNLFDEEKTRFDQAKIDGESYRQERRIYQAQRQGLEQKVEQRDQELRERDQEIRDLKRRLERSEQQRMRQTGSDYFTRPVSEVKA